ncbi:MAG: condensation domain-containing protein, partial [Pseudomonadota bacterium]
DIDATTGLSVPIGRPIDHAHIYLLDNHQQLMPRGAIGEIAIGGVGVARGYRDRDALNSERFVDNPFRPGERMYLTGDLARWRDDGTLAYHGRRDDQIKVNGVRVELGDVEAAVAAIPGVSAAAARLTDSASASEETFCQRCGLSGRHPSARLDTDLICHICRVYADERERALKYFGSLDDLRRIVQHVVTSADGKPDSIMLLSGGKDSTYALCQLVDMGLTPLVFTLDNGFISEGAKANMRMICERLGLELIVGQTSAMNAIFVDSLNRFSNVCNGCFKTIYTLSVNLARERGIRYIFTGLSRGQIFETRVADQFTQRIFDPAEIDHNIIEARKAYHRADDAVSKHLDTSAFETDDVFDDIRYVDFYRYTDVSLDEMYNYLGHRIKWVRPADTGRSTNCLINEAGIFVHKAERGFHNYSMPYSWDVRLGHKERDAARDELDDRINVDAVRAILQEIGYDMPDPSSEFGARRRLVAYYVADADLDTTSMRASLSATLPRAVIPSQFVRLTALPLTQNGKVDRPALPDPDDLRPDLAVDYVAPDGVVERKLAAIWQNVLGVDRIGANDNFFDLGGDSILNIQIVGRARKQGLRLKPQQIFEHATVRELARVVDDRAANIGDDKPVTGPVPLSPIQHRFFERCRGESQAVLDHYNQSVLLTATTSINPDMLNEALGQVVRQHDALRARYTRHDGQDGQWEQSFGAVEQTAPALTQIDLSDLPPARHASRVRRLCAEANTTLRISDARLLRALLFERGHGLAPWLFLTVHHLAVDGVSWWILLEDLQSAYTQLRDGRPVDLPPRTTSVKTYVNALTNYAPKASERWRRAQPLGGMDSVLPTDRPAQSPPRAGDSARIDITLNRDQTSGLLVDAATAWRAQAPDVLLGALANTLCDWLGADAVTIDVEHHGREAVSPDLDVLRTVGWFTSLFPVRLTRSATDPASWVRDAKTMLRSLPDNGLAYGAARYLGATPLEGDNTVAPIQFNYLGQWDRARSGGHWFAFAEPLWLSQSDDAPREHALDLDVMSFDGQLTLMWTYCTRRFDRDTIEALANRYREALTALVEAVRNGADAALTAADFQSADISQTELDNLISDLGDGL